MVIRRSDLASVQKPLYKNEDWASDGDATQKLCCLIPLMLSSAAPTPSAAAQLDRGGAGERGG